MSLSELQELVKDRNAWRAVGHGVAKSWTRLSGWTEWCLLQHYSRRHGSNLNAHQQSNGQSRCDMIHIRDAVVLSHSKEWHCPFAATGAQPEITVLGEGQRRTNTLCSHLLSHDMLIQHMAQTNSIYRTETDSRHREQTCGHQESRGGWGKDRSLGLSETLTYRMDKQQGSAVGEGNQSISCDKRQRRKAFKKRISISVQPSHLSAQERLAHHCTSTLQ